MALVPGGPPRADGKGSQLVHLELEGDGRRVADGRRADGIIALVAPPFAERPPAPALPPPVPAVSPLLLPAERRQPGRLLFTKPSPGVGICTRNLLNMPFLPAGAMPFAFDGLPVFPTKLESPGAGAEGEEFRTPSTAAVKLAAETASVTLLTGGAGGWGRG